MTNPLDITPTKSRRGFASLTPDQRKAMASKGGSSVPDHKRSFAVNRELAASAGRIGGLVSHSRKVTK